MKACPGQKVKISLPKAYQTANPKKSLVIKGVPAEVTEQEFKEFLDRNKISYAKAERLTSKKQGRVLEKLKLKTKDDTEAEALITENLIYAITGIIYRVEEFRTPISVQQCWNCQSFGHSAKICRSKTKCLICHHKGCPNEEKKQPVVKDHMFHPTKCVQHAKNRHLDNMWLTAKNHMPQFYAKTRFPHNPKIRHSHFRQSNS